MSASTTCDNCGNTATNDDSDAVVHWIKVGWHDGTSDDACSIDCGRALLDAMQTLEWEIEQETTVEESR